MRNFAELSLICIICLFSLAQATQAQRGGPRPGGPPPPGGDGGPMLRYHEVVQSDGTVTLVPATVASSLPSQVQIRIEGDWRIIDVLLVIIFQLSLKISPIWQTAKAYS